MAPERNGPVPIKKEQAMSRPNPKTVTFGDGRTYTLDQYGFLDPSGQWDEDFASTMAANLHIPEGLTERHWEIIRYIRDSFRINGECPLVYQTCRANRLSLKDLKSLFPTGYQRGACLLAGITFRDHLTNYYGEPAPTAGAMKHSQMEKKFYRVDVFGFLQDPSEWDEDFAIHRAVDMKIPGGLSERHWKLIRYLRDAFDKNQAVPTVFEFCDANNLELHDLESLFPGGYHRCAVKIAGLKA